MHSNAKKIILTANLQGFFYEGLAELNRKSQTPVHDSAIYYSSDVLDKFALSEAFFDFSEGKVREKILGIKLLEASHQQKEDQKRLYKEVGDMSLLVCGYFSESVNKKLVDLHYYSNLGRLAYQNLHNINPDAFFGTVGASFEALTTLMAIFANQNRTQDHSSFILPALTKKVS